MARVLHVLSQRPLRTGSGVTLDALVRNAAADGFTQHAVVGVPADEPRPPVADLEPHRIDAVRFGAGGDLPYAVPGMSDVMPYPSTRFSTLDEDAVNRYVEVWEATLRRVAQTFRPDVVHAHHVWLVGSILKDVVPDVPVVTHCHATGFRQMELCPKTAERVRRGCARNDAFVALHTDDAGRLARTLGVPRSRVHVVGAGYREDLFHERDRTPRAGRHVAYVGKLSRSKGVPQLLDAIERLAAGRPELRLHVAGGGSGPEADDLRRRMAAMAPVVEVHGTLTQPELAELLRRCDVCALPSFYEGLPLVLAEGRACGCAVVATGLPGVLDTLAPALGDSLQVVPRPRMIAVDEPDPDDLPSFTDRLVRALEAALVSDPSPPSLDAWTWRAVYHRIRAVWRSVGAEGPGYTR